MESCCKHSGPPGQNIPIDLYQEHLNHLVKTTIQTLGANKTENAVVRCSKALGPLGYSSVAAVREQSGAHRKPYKKDIAIIINELKQCKLFRSDTFFLPKPRNLSHMKPASSIISWIVTQLNHTNSNKLQNTLKLKRYTAVWTSYFSTFSSTNIIARTYGINSCMKTFKLVK